MYLRPVLLLGVVAVLADALLRNYAYVAHVAEDFIVVQAISNDESVGDAEARVVCLESIGS